MSLEFDAFEQKAIETADWEGMGNGTETAKAHQYYYVLTENVPHHIWKQGFDAQLNSWRQKMITTAPQKNTDF